MEKVDFKFSDELTWSADINLGKKKYTNIDFEVVNNVITIHACEINEIKDEDEVTILTSPIQHQIQIPNATLVPSVKVRYAGSIVTIEGNIKKGTQF